ncbi:MAG: hypothetical protein ACXWYM_25060, partial [Candidatus Binatia bacterium]
RGATSAPNNINLVDPDLKLPQVARYSLAVDRQLPFGLVATVEGLYTQNIHELLYQNLRIVRGTTMVEGRPAYSLRANTLRHLRGEARGGSGRGRAANGRWQWLKKTRRNSGAQVLGEIREKES